MKLHLIINIYGKIVKFYLTSENINDANEKFVDKLISGLKNKLVDDREYLSTKIFKNLWSKGIKLITKIRKNMKNKLMDFEEKMLLRKRAVIESVFLNTQRILSFKTDSTSIKR